MRLSDIKAQETAIRTLKSSIQHGSVAHSFLFTGSESIGKSTTAMAFASALNCANPGADGDACGLCQSCLRIQSGTDADVSLISPDGNQTKIEQMQDMIKDLNYAPLSGKYKVFIIEQADTLNPSSENCILKILEEPPSYTVLILLSSNPNSLLPTIRSRCRTVRFRKAGLLELKDLLKDDFNFPDDEIQAIAACSNGAIGHALSMASDPEFTRERHMVIQALITWLDGPSILSIQTAELLRGIAEPAKNDPDKRTRVRRLIDMLQHIISWYADMLAIKVRGNSDTVTNEDYLEDLLSHVQRYDLTRLRSAIPVVMNTRRYLEGNITPQLALENMFLELHPGGK